MFCQWFLLKWYLQKIAYFITCSLHRTLMNLLCSTSDLNYSSDIFQMFYLAVCFKICSFPPLQVLHGVSCMARAENSNASHDEESQQHWFFSFLLTPSPLLWYNFCLLIFTSVFAHFNKMKIFNLMGLGGWLCNANQPKSLLSCLWLEDECHT